jgi:hypothetical protein
LELVVGGQLKKKPQTEPKLPIVKPKIKPIIQVGKEKIGKIMKILKNKVPLQDIMKEPTEFPSGNTTRDPVDVSTKAWNEQRRTLA